MQSASQHTAGHFLRRQKSTCVEFARCGRLWATVHVLRFVFRFGSIAGADMRAQATGARQVNVLSWCLCKAEQIGDQKVVVEFSSQVAGVVVGKLIQQQFLRGRVLSVSVPVLHLCSAALSETVWSHVFVFINTVTPDPFCSCPRQSEVHGTRHLFDSDSFAVCFTCCSH